MVAVDLPVSRRAVMVQGIGVIFVASVLFGAMAVCVRLAVREMPAMQVAWVRFTGSLLVLLAATRGRGLRPRAANVGPLLLRGLLGASAIILYYVGIQGAGAGFATLLHCTYPISTAVFAVTVMGEAFSARLVTALALNLTGVVIVLGGAAVSPQVTLGGMSALAASVFAGGAVATARHLRATENAALITTYFMFVGTLLTTPALMATVPPLTESLAAALVGVVVTSVAGQWLLHHGLGYTSATQGSLAAATSVVTAAALEAAFLGEHVSLHTLAGACFMIIAVGLAVGRR